MPNLNPDKLPIKLIFQGAFRNLRDEKAILFYRIEVFDSRQNLWLSIIEGQTRERGILVEEWEITKDNFKKDTLPYLVGEVIGSRGMAVFRLVEINDKQEPTGVWLAASTWLHADIESKLVVVDFGNKILTDPRVILPFEGVRNVQRMPIGAIFESDPRSEISGALLAALANPTIYEKYDPEKQDLIVLDKFTSELKEVDTATVIYDIERKEVVSGTIRRVIEGNPIERLESDLNQLQFEYEKLTEEKLALSNTLDGKILENSLLNAELEGVKAELEEYKNGTIYTPQKSVPVNEVLRSIATEVESTSAILSTGKYALTNVSLDLKAFVLNSPEGKLSLQLLDSEVSRGGVEGATISTLSMDLLPNSVGQAVPAGLVPRVIGMTETMARKKLMSVGLRMNAVYHSLHSDVIPPGHSFKQLPEGGADAQPGDEVTVIFAKQSSQSNTE